jgi:hypothetical protein
MSKLEQRQHMGSLTEFWQQRESLQVTFGDGDSQPGSPRVPGGKSSDTRHSKGTGSKG